MTRYRALPKLMVAPNGARRGKPDHPALPVTLEETISTARACVAEGADGLHLHVREAGGTHSLDTGLYKDAIAALSDALPDLFLQVTSESGGRYSAEEQRAMIRDLRPAFVSVALREMIRAPDDRPAAKELYYWAAANEVVIQHIVYTPDELNWFLREIDRKTIPGDRHQLQLVLGSYDSTAPPEPGTLDAYIAPLTGRHAEQQFDWMVCAFGPLETACLVEAARRGGKLRVGFENSLWNADGSIARDNAHRVREVSRALDAARRDGSDLIAS